MNVQGKSEKVSKKNRLVHFQCPEMWKSHHMLKFPDLSQSSALRRFNHAQGIGNDLALPHLCHLKCSFKRGNDFKARFETVVCCEISIPGADANQFSSNSFAELCTLTTE